LTLSRKRRGDKTLADYIMENKGIFLCGKLKAANEILTRRGKIIVAMTDRRYDNQYNLFFPDNRIIRNNF